LSLAEIDQVVLGCLERVGIPLVCWRVPRIIGLPKRSSLHDRPVALRRTVEMIVEK
jgi:hypothetical protein